MIAHLDSFGLIPESCPSFHVSKSIFKLDIKSMQHISDSNKTMPIEDNFACSQNNNLMSQPREIQRLIIQYYSMLSNGRYSFWRLVNLAAVCKSFRTIIFTDSIFWSKQPLQITAKPNLEAFEPCLRNLLERDLSGHLRQTITCVKMEHSALASVDLVISILEKCTGIRGISLFYAQRINLHDLVHKLSGWWNQRKLEFVHPQLDTFGSLDVERCGEDTVNKEGWYVSTHVGFVTGRWTAIPILPL